MQNHEQPTMDWAHVAVTARDVLISAVLGWVGMEGAGLALRHMVSEESQRMEPFQQAEPIITLMAGLTVGGLVFTYALHRHAKRSSASREESP